MHTKIVTTITSEIDLDTMEPTHSVDVECEDDIPEIVAYAAVLGGCRATASTVMGRHPSLADDDD